LIYGKTLPLVRPYAKVGMSLTSTRRVARLADGDNEETLDLDEEQYPRLPENVLGFRLNRRKAILRLYMAAVRRSYHPKIYTIRCC
jgi:hypothetical protein